jgi:hypothetical protein
MSYTPKYTTLENISLKLNNRLKIEDPASNYAYEENALATQTVPPQLVENVIQEQEDFLDQYLALVYELPLVNTHLILRQCVDCLVISELLELFYPYTGMNNSGNNNAQLKVKGLNIIQALTHNINVFIPYPGSGGVYPKEGFKIRPLILEGENLRLSAPIEMIPENCNTITGNFVETTKTTVGEGKEIQFDIEDQYKSTNSFC